MELERIIRRTLDKAQVSSLIEIKIWKTPEEWLKEVRLPYPGPHWLQEYLDEVVKIYAMGIRPADVQKHISISDQRYILDIVESGVNRFNAPFLALHEAGHVLAGRYGADEVDRRLRRSDAFRKYLEHAMLTIYLHASDPVKLVRKLRSIGASFYHSFNLITHDLMSDLALYLHGFSDELAVYKMIKIHDWYESMGKAPRDPLDFAICLPNVSYSCYHPDLKRNASLCELVRETYNLSQGEGMQINRTQAVFRELNFPPKFENVAKCIADLYDLLIDQIAAHV